MWTNSQCSADLFPLTNVSLTEDFLFCAEVCINDLICLPYSQTPLITFGSLGYWQIRFWVLSQAPNTALHGWPCWRLPSAQTLQPHLSGIKTPKAKTKHWIAVNSYNSVSKEVNVDKMFVWDVLRDLVPSVQIKKYEKHPWRIVNFSKVPSWYLQLY